MRLERRMRVLCDYNARAVRLERRMRPTHTRLCILYFAKTKTSAFKNNKHLKVQLVVANRECEM